MHDLPLLTTIAAAFAAAWVLGIITQKLGLSPIVGYLLAGVVIGPHTPGFVGDIDSAQQLAEVGVILMMFGVGLHFHLKDLLAVKSVAVPGAVGQSLVATALAVGVFYLFGWPLRSGLVLGVAMSVASTVVLLRVLMDADQLKTFHGTVAVGWLLVEDVFTVLVLVLIPIMAGGTAETHAVDALAPEQVTQGGGLAAVGWAVAKLAALVAIVFLAGSRVVPCILIKVARLRSQELFTLTVLVLSITIAVGSASLFGASVALGAFLAGMVVAQSPVSHQAAADALPMRDAFAVLFFVAVGMLFDPAFLLERPLMVAAGLGIVMIAKPLAALAIVAALGYSARTALTVALALSQIGEFSFILSQVAREHALMTEDGNNVLVATAMISITLNPLIFRAIEPIESWLRARPRLWRLVNGRADRRVAAINADAAQAIHAGSQPRAEAPDAPPAPPPTPPRPLAIIIGHGPVGRVVDAMLRDAGMETVVIELNMDTVQSLTRAGHLSIFGDATRREVLEQAGVRRASHLVITLPHSAPKAPLILMARELNAQIEVTVRARYLAEREELQSAGATKIVFEEGESGIALARHVLERRGLEPSMIEKILIALRRLWRMQD